MNFYQMPILDGDDEFDWESKALVDSAREYGGLVLMAGSPIDSSQRKAEPICVWRCKSRPLTPAHLL